jgi:hypothetical protein
VSSGTARQLTNDRYGDLQPTWAPSGERLAFVTDRGPDGTDFSSLRFGPPRLALIDVETGAVDPLRPFPRGQQHNPQFTPDGTGLYFISDHDGFKDLYHLDLISGRTARLTTLQTGVSGFTALSPALSVSARSGRMMFSVFSDNEYSILSLAPETVEARIAQGGRDPDGDEPPALGPIVNPDTVGADSLVAPAGVLPPWTGGGVIEEALQSPTAGLPTEPYGEVQSYRPRLQLDAIAPPTIGVAVGGGFGTRLGGSVGFYFSDMLGEHNLSVEALANGTFQDLGGQVTYVNREQRLNYGAQLSHIPFLSIGGFVEQNAQGVIRYREIQERIFADQLGVLGLYPLRSTRRLEAQTNLTRYGFDREIRDFFFFPDGGVRREDRSADAPDPLYLSQTAAAYVVDYSNFGFTSPVQGGRYRLEVGATLGDAQYATVLADMRRYLRAGPVTFAGRVLHIGNYGAQEGDVFSEEYLGFSFEPGYLRGYSFYSFDPEECAQSVGEGETDCAPLDRLVGTRVAAAGLEVRVPLLGTEQYGLINFPYLPTELSLFVDSGVTWTAEDPPVWEWARDTNERVPVVSTGVSARMNLFGAAIVEVFYAYPYQRPDKGGFIGVGLVPGW